MNKDRIDELLAEALATGEIPAGVTAAERIEIARLVETTASLRSMRAAIEGEASATMPTARARFERHIAAGAATARPVPAAVRHERSRRGSWWGAMLLNRTMMGSGAAAAIGIIAVLAVFLSQNAFQGVETASAQVLTPGDYVQIEGVVGETKDGRVSVHSEFGDFDFDLSTETSVVNGQESSDLSGVKAGASVLVGGIVGKDRVVAANTVSLSATTPAQPKRLKLVQLKELRPNLIGKVTVLTISPDGTKGRVHIDTGDGQRFVVPVDGQSAEELIERFSTALGAKVEVGAVGGSKPGTFRLQVQDSPPPPPAQVSPAATRSAGSLPAPTTVPGVATDPASPRFVDVRGVILGRVGNTVRVQTLRGPVIAELRRTSRILPGQSGLTVETILRGDAVVGHEITISGGLDAASGHVVIDVAVLGPKRPGRP